MEIFMLMNGILPSMRGHVLVNLKEGKVFYFRNTLRRAIHEHTAVANSTFEDGEKKEK
jgi:hypothetical protein